MVFCSGDVGWVVVVECGGCSYANNGDHVAGGCCVNVVHSFVLFSSWLVNYSVVVVVMIFQVVFLWVSMGFVFVV